MSGLGYCDCAVDAGGRLAFVYGTVDMVFCEGRWGVAVPRQALDLRCGLALGSLVAIWKDGDPTGGTVRFSVDGAVPVACGLAFGTNSVCVGPDGLYIVRSGVRIEVVNLNGHTVRGIDMPATSQGIRDITPSGELRLADDWFVRTVGGVNFYQPVQRGGVLVGQTDPAQIAGIHGLNLFTAIQGFGFEPHLAALPGDRWAICARTPDGPKLVTVPPYPPFQSGQPVPPNPIPPNPGGPVQLPDHVFATLQTVRPKYPTPLGDRGAELLNEVAWTHRAEGYGLESKGGGTVCPQPTTGKTCGCDILRTQTLGWDVLIDAEGAGTPVQADSGPADPARFVSPVQPAGQPVPVPPNPTPVPPTGSIEERVTKLEEDMALLKATNEARFYELDKRTGALEAWKARCQSDG